MDEDFYKFVRMWKRCEDVMKKSCDTRKYKREEEEIKTLTFNE